jgi:hypothetical protein
VTVTVLVVPSADPDGNATGGVGEKAKSPPGVAVPEVRPTVTVAAPTSGSPPVSSTTVTTAGDVPLDPSSVELVAEVNATEKSSLVIVSV